MKDISIIAGIVIAAIAVIILYVYGTRYISNTATPITLHQPAEGVNCAVVITGDGAAIDCWKE